MDVSPSKAASATGASAPLRLRFSRDEGDGETSDGAIAAPFLAAPFSGDACDVSEVEGVDSMGGVPRVLSTAPIRLPRRRLDPI
ncbi:MAG: hypothetical protein AAF728_05765 [Cyanobacteria bacterium P01_D01_bin.128]